MPPDLPVFRRWLPTTKVLIIAMDRQFVSQTISEAFSSAPELAVPIGATRKSRKTAIQV